MVVNFLMTTNKYLSVYYSCKFTLKLMKLVKSTHILNTYILSGGEILGTHKHKWLVYAKFFFFHLVAMFYLVASYFVLAAFHLFGYMTWILIMIFCNQYNIYCMGTSQEAHRYCKQAVENRNIPA